MRQSTAPIGSNRPLLRIRQFIASQPNNMAAITPPVNLLESTPCSVDL